MGMVEVVDRYGRRSMINLVRGRERRLSESVEAEYLFAR